MSSSFSRAPISQWVRFRIEADRAVAGGLKHALVAAYPLLAAAAGINDVKTGGGLNIEALEITPDRQAVDMDLSFTNRYML